jgi:hypothetical protein
MIPIPAGCARFLCYGWIITGAVFLLGLNKNGEDLSGAGAANGAANGVRPLHGHGCD